MRWPPLARPHAAQALGHLPTAQLQFRQAFALGLAVQLGAGLNALSLRINLGQLFGGIGVGHVVAQLRAVALLNLCRLVLQCIAAACLYVLNMSITS